MEFLKISETTLRCVLKEDELKQQNICAKDMILGTQPAREFLSKIIIKACSELDMKLETKKFSVHVMPLPDERLDLVISAFEDDEKEQDTTDAFALHPPIAQKKFLLAIYRFHSLVSAEQFSKRIAGTYVQKSSLFKEPQSNTYYLCLHEKRKKFRALTNIAAEYGTLYSMEPAAERSLKEHCEVILKSHAVTYLAALDAR